MHTYIHPVLLPQSCFLIMQQVMKAWQAQGVMFEIKNFFKVNLNSSKARLVLLLLLESHGVIMLGL